MKCEICGEKLRKSDLPKKFLNEFEFFKLRKIKKDFLVCIDCQTSMLLADLS